MRKKFTSGVAFATLVSVLVLTGCSGESKNDWDINVITPTVSSDALEIPDGVLPYTVETTPENDDAITRVTFNYPELWQSSSNRNEIGVNSEANSELLGAFVSANGEGLVIERFQEEKIVEEISTKATGVTRYLSVLPGSKTVDSYSQDNAETVTNEVVDNENITQTSRILESIDGYSYSVTLIQRAPSELTEEQVNYILDSFIIGE